MHRVSEEEAVGKFEGRHAKLRDSIPFPDVLENVGWDECDDIGMRKRKPMTARQLIINSLVESLMR
jgi:hypothetical protein